MPAVRVREALESVEKRQAGGVPVGEVMTSEQLNCEGGKKALSSRVICAIATTAHGSRESSFAEPSTEGQARVVAALVRVMHDPSVGRRLARAIATASLANARRR